MPDEKELNVAAVLKAMEEEFEAPKMNVNGRMVDAVTVPVDHVVERHTEVHLTDGTVIQIRQNVIGATRAVGEWDPSGNPIYAMKMDSHMSIERTPKSLRGMPQMPPPIMLPKAGG